MNEVKVVSVTAPRVEGIETPDQFLAYVARVSNPSNQANNETAPKLIKYLMKNAHWSPFEMVHLTIEIKTTRDIARQILRHRSFSFQEFSQRYAEVTEFSEPREARLQDKKNRQNSISPEEQPTINVPYEQREKYLMPSALPLDAYWEILQSSVMAEAGFAYQMALENGIAKEVARAVLPEGLTMSTLYMSGSLRSWIHYCDLRCGNGTQKEHRLVAEGIRDLIDAEFPSIRGAREAIEEERKAQEWARLQALMIERAERDEYGGYVLRF